MIDKKYLLENAGVDVGQRHNLFFLFVHTLERKRLDIETQENRQDIKSQLVLQIRNANSVTTAY